MFKISSQIGYKFFKKDDNDNVEIIRLVKAKSYKDPTNLPAIVTIEKEDGTREKIESKLLNDYTPLEPDGVVMFSIVELGTDEHDKPVKDVVVTGVKFLNMKLGDTAPFVICRQNIVDIYNNLIVRTDDDIIYGCSINQSNCPTNYDFRAFLMADKVVDTITVNIYRMDTLDDILALIETKEFDSILENNNATFIKNEVDKKDIAKAMFKKSYKGWCKSLKQLLLENNFQSDINEMFGIIDVEFKLSDFMVTRKLPNEEEYDSVIDDMILWFSGLYNAPIQELTVLEYYHDINLGDFNNSRYFFLRDNTKKLYMLVYTINGEIKEADLVEKVNKTNFSDKFKLSFFNKYGLDGSSSEIAINI